jgi:transposase
VALVDVATDREVWMLYSSFLRALGPGLIWAYGPQAQAIAGGTTGGGPDIPGSPQMPVLNWEELAHDLRLARHYRDQILIHSLKGCVWQGFLPRLRSLEWADDARPPQHDRPLLLPVDMREWLPEDNLVFVVLDAVATLDLGEFYRLYRADGHGRAAFEPEMMAALLLYGSCQGERSSRMIEKRCVRDVGYRVITGGLRPGHATIARFRARHEKPLGGLFSQVLRLLAGEGMVCLGVLSLDGTKLAGNAAQKGE